MAVLTENEVRRLVGKEQKGMTEIYVEKGQIITPSAKSYLIEKNIEIKYIDNKSQIKTDSKAKKVETKINNIKKDTKPEETVYKYTTVFGGKLENKPEYMTQIRGNILVFKDHKIIALRGKIDSLESKILETQIICQKNNMPKLVDELEEILSFVRNIMRCEVVEEKMNDFKLLGLTPDELRQQSHYPKKYFGIDHEYPSYKMGEVVVAINSLRTNVREAELCAYEAFKDQYGQVEREDIIRALNRLSSLFWILIFKVRTDKYK